VRIMVGLMVLPLRFEEEFDERAVEREEEEHYFNKDSHPFPGISARCGDLIILCEVFQTATGAQTVEGRTSSSIVRQNVTRSSSDNSIKGAEYKFVEEDSSASRSFSDCLHTIGR
ncbi:serine/threonine protein phosphatase 4 regulatory subunit, partial [Trifolium medium]|nr:serine/threonine protein phosphatase 4 regulatory subunit [Trifolium medium]